MIDALKKTLYAGVGATVVTAEKVEAALKELVEKGRISAEEASETARKIARESKQEFEEAKSDMGDLFDSMLSRAHVATRAEVALLEKRIATLERVILEAANKEQGGPGSPSAHT